MDLKDYQKLCKHTAKKFGDKDKEIMTWGLGIAGEAGNVAGCIKKTYSQGDDQKKGTRENLGDTMRDNVLAELFETEKDPIAVIKLKEIYQDAETVLDICEDVAHVVQSILVKQA